MTFLRSRLAPVIRACSAGIVCVAAATGAASAQFKTGTALVVVDVVVTGEDGRPVPDLTAADFELFEDGARALSVSSSSSTSASRRRKPSRPLVSRVSRQPSHAVEHDWRHRRHQQQSSG